MTNTVPQAHWNLTLSCQIRVSWPAIDEQYMHVSRESDFDSFESNNLQFFILACVVRLQDDIAESWTTRQWVNNATDPQQFAWFDLRSQQSTFAWRHTDSYRAIN